MPTPPPPPFQPIVYICPQTRLTEIASAGFALWWTILLLLPTHLFASNLVFLGLQRISSEHGWVLGTAATFSIQLIGWKSGSPLLRWVGCMTAGLLWIFVTTGVCIGAHKWHIVIPVNTGVGAYGVTGMANLYCAAFILPRYCLPEFYALHTLGMADLRARLANLRRNLRGD